MQNSNRIIMHITDSATLNPNIVFKLYKYAIAEMPPFKLSTGKWLHIYKCTPYAPYDLYADGSDPDEEVQAYYSECFG